ncbi:MAG: pyrimidine/purine nucleoside phosphorylase [Proteobacteria bacterium]|nr:pyrimidine/purine nucleoside phosphorylase [Pseudomonadota bacterium]MCH9711105.1 pyrimidine/purine nucleoside phosphorylase [Pseudomonadota bacterium]MCH9750079.1 pyrimidine/purine nucleoside phosphorylase [Pseudomonadota bacterium]
MSSFKNVEVVKAANIYFDGKVTSRVVVFADGSKKTLGIMMPGDYEFGTDDNELMEIQAGEMDVLLPGENDWKTFTKGTSFEVPKDSSFKLKVKTVTDYCCSYY